MAAPKGTLSLSLCLDCDFVFNQEFDSQLISYDAEYENSQDFSPVFQSHLDKIQHYLLKECGIRDARIVEVGCGKGRFLSSLLEDAANGNIGFGFDPTYVGELARLNGRVQFIRSFYGPEFSKMHADVVLCRHVIEHVADPVALLKAVYAALENSPGARLFFETPCVEWILDNQVIWDFFYEHCSLFTQSSIRTCFERAGFQVDSVKHVFGGQYLWIEASVPKFPPRAIYRKASLQPRATAFTRSERALLGGWRKRIDQLLQVGKVALWGGGAKGITFANLIDPCCERLDCIVDLNPYKQNLFAGISGHAVVHYLDLRGRGVKSAIVMNPNYLKENLALIQAAGMNVTLVNGNVSAFAAPA